MAVPVGTRRGILTDLDDRVSGIKSACGRFDQGEFVAAREIAVHLGALIDLLGLQHELTWVDTAGVLHPKTLSPSSCLTLMKITSGPQRHAEYVPKLGLYPPAPIRTRDGGRIERGSRIPFDHWWTNTVVRDADGVEYCRKYLMLCLVGQDSPATAAVTRASARNPVLASVRQIGYEVLESLRQQRDVIATVG